MAVAKSLDELAHAFTGEASLPTFFSPIPGDTYCEGCSRLRAAHVDDVCIWPAGGKHSRRLPAGDDVQAQLAVAVTTVKALVDLLRRSGGPMKPEDQETLWNAEALLVEVKG